MRVLRLSHPPPTAGRRDSTPDPTPLLAAHTPAFSQPTGTRFVTLFAAALLTPGRTVAHLLRPVGRLAPGHVTSYRRVLPAARWPGVERGCALTRLILGRFRPDGPVPGGGRHHREPPGPAGVREGAAPPPGAIQPRLHRRAVRAQVGTAGPARSPFATRPWALPALADLYRPPEVGRGEGRRHRTPAQLACRLLRLILSRFPARPFVFVGDSGYGTHEVVRFCHRHRARPTLVSKCHPDANLFAPPPPYRGNGRPPVKGRRLPKPRQAVAGLPPPPARG